MSTRPEPPKDSESKKIIDTFAQYVAKNGPAFEEITRQKQYDNPKFSFLFGQEHADYYRCQLMREIQLLNSPSCAGTSFTNDTMEEINYEQEINALRKQIRDSESNLKAQNQVLQLQKQAQIENAYNEKEKMRINLLMQQVKLDIRPFETLINHMSTSGSKDTISNSKKWIFDNCQTDQLREVILTYLLYRVQLNTATDTFRLHILYLINDWAHYCQRKKLDNVRQMLSRYVPKLYAYAASSTTLDRSFSEKLDKLIGVWEGYKYFDDNCYKQLRNPTNIMATKQAQVYAEQLKSAAEVEKELEETYKSYEKQHQDFEKHILLQIAKLEAEQKRKENQQCELERQQQEMANKRKSRFDQDGNKCVDQENGPKTYISSNNENELSQKIPSLFAPNHSSMMSGSLVSLGPCFITPPIINSHIPPLLPDLIPKCPYYELPAGMMIPLVAEEDCLFAPIDEKKLRIPPPEPPSEHLLAQLDRFYNMHATPDNPRNNDGWEVKGLLDHYAKKRAHRARLEEKLKAEGKTIEDAIQNHYVAPPDEFDEMQKNKRKSRSNSCSSQGRSRSCSSSSKKSSSSNDSSRSLSRSQSRSNSNSPKRKKLQRQSLSPDDKRPNFNASSVSNKPTGLSFVSTSQINPNVFKAPLPPINRNENKGAQLMAKMGWEGRGLGAKEQGIEEPIHPGDVRDRNDQYRGIGSKADIFEEYRKKMSYRTGNRRRNALD